MYVAGRWRDVPFLERTDLDFGMRADGPALVAEDHSTTVVAPGWRLSVDGAGALRMDRGVTA